MQQAQMTVLLLAAITLQADPKNPRKAASSEDLRLELRLLGQDMKRRGVLVPLLVLRNGDVYIVIDGHRRREAALLVGIEKLPCIVLEKDVTEAEIREAQLVLPLHSQTLTPYEVYCGAKNWLNLHPGNNAKHLANAINRSEGYVSLVLSLDKCIPAAKQAAAEGKISLKDWHVISQAEDQAAALAAKLGGASSEELKRLRRGRNGADSKPTVRLSRFKYPLPSGVEITVAGKELSIGDLIDALGELVKEAKKAGDQGLDIKTLVAMAKDKARKRM
ncbi:MAG: ParB/RepB/Spo0J family partition protein [Gemmataceae bacterium]